mgnify:CR=1 FL=1
MNLVQPIASEFIDLDRYPIDQPGHDRDAVIADARAAIDRVGCAVLKGFVRTERLPALVAVLQMTAAVKHRLDLGDQVHVDSSHRSGSERAPVSMRPMTDL